MKDGRMRHLVPLLLVLTCVYCQESAQYLRNTLRDLRNINLQPNIRRADPEVASVVPVPHDKGQAVADRRYHDDEAPPLSLSKEELASLYQSAVLKEETLKLDTGNNSYVYAAVQEIDDHSGHGPSKHYSTADHEERPPTDDTSGYYYYYYPIKSFLDGMTSQTQSSHKYTYKPKPHIHHTTERPQFQYHSHHHQHNITIHKEMAEDKKKSALEPLFMTISGFIGMAVMFIFSVIFMPKFGAKPNAVPKPKGLDKKKDIEEFTRLAWNAIDQGVCAERFACELGKTGRTLTLPENRFVRFLKRIAPESLGKFYKRDNQGRYSNKLLKCTAIPCKKKPPNNNNAPKNQKKKNPQKKS